MNIRFKSTLPPAVILILSFTALACAAASWNGSTGMEDGWPVVDNPDKPMHKDETIVAEEIWRLGHEDDEQEMVFGLISDGLIDEDGITYLLDSHLTTIYKVSPDGEILGNIGREGDGPGEFRNIMNMIFMPDGSLGIFELMPGRIVTMGRDGDPRPRFSFGDDSSESMHNISRMAADENSVVLGYSVFEFSDEGLKSTNTLARYAPDGSVMNVLFSQSEDESGASVSFESEDGEFSRYWAMDKDGRVIVFKDNQKYSLDIFNPDGSHAMKIRRQYEPVRRSDEEIREDERSHEELRTSVKFSPAPTAISGCRTVRATVIGPPALSGILMYLITMENIQSACLSKPTMTPSGIIISFLATTCLFSRKLRTPRNARQHPVGATCR